MPRPPGRPRKDFIHPNREKLLELRDKYMRDMDAPSYSTVKEKFIQEIQSKRTPGESPQKEWGIGVWNNAFSGSGMMQRASIVLLAEFFGVEPEALILPTESQGAVDPSAASAAPGAAPSAAPSISVSGQHNQVAAAAGDVIIQGSIIQTAALPLPEDMP